MKIAYLIPGSGNAYYCENCRRDLPLVTALRTAGAEVSVVPLYMPPLCNGERFGDRVYCGAVSLSLRSALPFFQNHLPSVSRLLDSRPILDFLPAFSGLTRTKGLERITLSMIRGADLFQQSEFEVLVEKLGRERPDWIHLSNFLLAGVGVELKRRLGVKLSTILQDEDTWIESMREPWRSEAWALLRAQARETDLFLPLSEWYGDFLGGLLEIDPRRMDVVPAAFSGVQQERFPSETFPELPAIGFLSRACAENGLDDLASAYLLLREKHRDLRLLVAGGHTADDRAFLVSLRKKLVVPLREGHVELLPNPDPENLSRFLKRLSVLSVPAKHGSAFGSFLLEALAAGVPVVQPALGGYPEVLGSTGGGILYSPPSIERLASALDAVLSNPTGAFESARRAGEAVERLYAPALVASRFLEVLGSRLSDTVRSGSAVLSVSGVSKRFLNADGSVCSQVLDWVSLELRAGELLAVLGPSGSGKTTLLRICALLETHDGGGIYFRGEDLSRFEERRRNRYRNRNIGFVFQDHALLPELTVLENVLLPTLAGGGTSMSADRERNRARAMELLAAAELSGFESRFPETLSAGERQRTAVARSLVMGPDMVFADEPTASLDRRNAESIARLLRKLAAVSGTAVLLVTHDPAMASAMDRRLLLRDGALWTEAGVPSGPAAR